MSSATEMAAPKCRSNLLEALPYMHPTPFFNSHFYAPAHGIFLLKTFIYVVTTKFCTKYDSCNVMTIANISGKLLAKDWGTIKLIFRGTWIKSEKKGKYSTVPL